MKKFLETSFGSKGVDTLPPVRIAFNKLFAVYNEFQKLMQPSSYVNQDKSGRKIRVLFPMSNKVDLFTSLRQKFTEAKRQFLDLQRQSMEENPNYKSKYFSKKNNPSGSDFNPSWDWQKVLDYGEKHCWPNSKDDATVRSLADKVSEFCSLVHLRDNFEAQIQKYGSVRYKLEHKVITI